jgi:hypothetical protein
MAAPLKPDVKAAIDDLVSRGITGAREIGRRVGVGHVAAARRRDEYLSECDTLEAGEGVQSFEAAGDKAKVECVVHSSSGIVTDDDLARVCKLDLSKWRIVRIRVKAYQTGMKLTEKEQAPNGVVRRISETPHVVQLHSVSAELERVAPKNDLDSLPLIFAPLRDLAPRFGEFAPPPSDASVMLVIGLMDVHFGKLAWAAECGDDYDLKIAEHVFENAIEDLMAATAHLKVERIQLPIGNDLSHIDTPNNATTAGTVVDTDGRQPKIIAVIKRAVLRGILRLAERAPVDVFGVPGNHDYLATIWLMHVIDAYFDRTDRVSVDLEPTVRKYRQYGQTLLGFTHGDSVKDSQVRSLMSLMMVEQRDRISSTRFSEWFCGHQHRSRTFEQKSTDTYQGTVVRFLSALSGTDAWHVKNGLVGSRQAAEVYVYDKEQGYRGHFLAPARR